MPKGKLQELRWQDFYISDNLLSHQAPIESKYKDALWTYKRPWFAAECIQQDDALL